jgi:predicted dehydrogenase
MRAALVGCGNIAERYAQTILASGLELAGATDPAPGCAAALIERFGGREFPDLDVLLADTGVDVVVNLTPPHVHAAVTRAALEAGKHVHTEKPVALRYDEARALAELAAARGLRLSCAPSTWLGEALQTAWKLVRAGELGTVRAVYAEANWGRIESWHPSPQSLYAAGPVVDVGVYPLTALTAFFGPVRRVHAFATTLQPERVTKAGERFTLTTPDFTTAALELEDGPLVRLTATFWVGPGKQRGLELHGEERSLYVPTWAEFDSRVQLTRNGEEYEDVPLLREPFHGIDFARPLVDLAEALRDGRPHRAGAEHAAHVVEVMNAIEAAGRDGGAVDVRSSFPAPAPLDWAV